MKKSINVVLLVCLPVLLLCGCERERSQADRNKDVKVQTPPPTVNAEQYRDFSFDIEDRNAYPCMHVDQEKNIVNFSGVETAEVLYIDYSNMAYHFLAESREEIEKLHVGIQTDGLNHCEKLKLLILDDECRKNYIIDTVPIQAMKQKGIVVCCYPESPLWDQLTGQGVACVSIESVDLEGLKQKSPPLFVMEGSDLLACSEEVMFEKYFKDKRLRLPEDIRKIGANVFMHTDSYRSVEFPESLEKIDNYAFYCSNIKQVRFLGSKLKRIEDFAFCGCGKITNISLPEGLEYIGKHAFTDTKIRKIKIPGSVKTIEQMAFSCFTLSEISLSEELEYIGENAFVGTKIQKIKIPKSVKKIDSRAFYTCKKLSELSLSDGIEYIGMEAFSDTAVRTVKIPKSVKKIEKNAFDKKVKLVK